MTARKPVPLEVIQYSLGSGNAYFFLLTGIKNDILGLGSLPVPLAQVEELLAEDAGKGGTDDSPHHRLFRHTACKKCAKFVRMQAKVGPMIPPTSGFYAIPPAKNALYLLRCRQRWDR
jgi:hypothetical protein